MAESRGLLAGLDRWWFEPAPALRLAVLRVLIVGFAQLWLLAMAPLLLGTLRFPADRFEPIGVVAWLLDAPVAPALGVAIWALTWLLGLAALVGLRYRVVAPLFALGLLWVATYRSCWGMIFHTENLLIVHVLVLALLPASDAWSLDARARGPISEQPSPRYGWGPKLMATLGCLAYLLAGIAKLRNAGSQWLSGEVLLTHVAWDNARKLELGDFHSPIGAWLSRYPGAFAPLAWLSVLFEIGAPLALLGGRPGTWLGDRLGNWPARIWAAGMWAFHFGVVLLMAIVFIYPLLGIAFAPLFAVELPARRLAERLHQRRPHGVLARLFAGCR